MMRLKEWPARLLRRPGLSLVIAVLAAAGSVGVWQAATQAVGTTTLRVDPASKILLYSNRTPITEQIKLDNTVNLGAYQFTLRWNASVLEFVSSDLSSTYLASTGRVPLCIVDTIDNTPTPTGTPPTPTNTPTPAVPTATMTATPTPHGYVSLACVSLGTPGQVGIPAGPTGNGTIATFQFKSIASAPGSSSLGLSNVQVTNVLGTPVAPLAVGNGFVNLAGCYDIDGDGYISILDLSILASHFLSTPTNPRPPTWTWNPAYDINNDGSISILDLSLVAAGFGLSCAP